MFAKTIATVMTLAAAAMAHMQISYPCPRFSPHCATTPTLPAGESLNYNLAGPIGSDGDILAPLCQSATPWPQVNEKWTAGQSITVKFVQGGAAHGGGHCEFSLSYDGGKTFVVVHQELQYCFVGSASNSNTASTLSYTFSLPSDLPSTDHAVFAWSWVNAVGNREFYMDCADVSISGSSKSYTGRKMTIANYGSAYPTIPEFNGDYTTGLNYYQSAANITVTGSGSSSGSDSSASVSYSTSAAATSVASAAATSGASGASGASAATASASSTDIASDAASAATTSDAAPTSSPTRAAHTPAASSASASSSPASSAPASSSVAPATSSAAVPTSSTGSSSDSCNPNEYKCTSDGKSFLQCDNGAWANAIACPSITACFQAGKSIYCGFAQ